MLYTADSPLKSKARAVEQAAVVLLCFTEKYKNSLKCRTGYSYHTTRNNLNCYQSNYSSRAVFSHIPIQFGQTGVWKWCHSLSTIVKSS